MSENIPAPHEFKTDELELTVHHQPACIVEFHVTASPALVKSIYQRAVKAVRKDVSIPGFRKGKAPDEVVVKRFAKQIDAEWKQEIANSLFPKCETLANIPILQRDSKVNFDVEHCSLEEGAKYRFRFETQPTVPVIDPKEFILSPSVVTEVTEAQVEETIRQILFFFAEWTPVSDRAVQEGDFVLLNVDVINDDHPESLFAKTRFEVSDKSMAKWMKALILGQEEGAVLEGVSTPDEETPEAKKEFPEKQVKITILEIEQATLPSLDEKLLKILGVPTEQELHGNVKKLLQDQSRLNTLEKEREQTVEFLLRQYPVPLPQSLVIKEAQFRLQQLFEDDSFKEHWEDLTEEKRKEFILSLGNQAEKAVRMFFLCKQLLTQANISLTAQDLPQPATSTLEMLIRPSSAMPHAHDDKLKEAEAYSRLILEKGQDYLVTFAKNNGNFSKPEEPLQVEESSPIVEPPK